MSTLPGTNADGTPEVEAEPVADDEPAETADGEQEAADDDGSAEEPAEEPEEPTRLQAEEWSGMSARLWTEKVNGEEVTKPLGEWVAEARKGVAAEERFQQAATARKEAEEKSAAAEEQLGEVRTWFADLLTPEQMIAQIHALGPAYARAFDEAAELRLAASQAEAELTPEQRKIRDLERKLAARERAEKAEKETAAQTKAREEKERAEATAAYQKRVTTAITAALTTAGLQPESEEWMDGEARIIARARRRVAEGKEVDEAEIAKIGAALFKPAPKPKPKPPPPAVRSGGRRGTAPKPKARQTVRGFFDQLADELPDPSSLKPPIG